MCLIRVRAKLCRSGPDLRMPDIDSSIFIHIDALEKSTLFTRVHRWIPFIQQGIHNSFVDIFIRHFYPKRLTVHLGYTFLSLVWVNLQPFALLTQCSTTEPQEHLSQFII